MLPVVDKPAIQYVVEEAVARRHRRHPHHHRPRQAQPRGPLRPRASSSSTSSAARASTTLLAEVRELTDLADIHYVRQGEPLGLGHAVSVARKHVGDQPFVVLLGDDIMDGRPTVLGRDDRHVPAPPAPSVIALMEVPPEQISALRLRVPEPGPAAGLLQIDGIVEKPAVDDAPSTWPCSAATCSRPEIFDAIAQVRAGHRRRDPAHRRHRPPARGAPRPCSATCSTTGASTSATSTTTCGPRWSWPLGREDLGPAFRTWLAAYVREQGIV